MGGCLSQLTATHKASEPKQIVLPKRSSQQAETPRNSNFFMDRLVSLESPRSPASPRYVNAAYFPQYIARHERYPSTFDLTKLSHVFYAYASIDEEGGLIFSDEVVDFSLQVDGTNGYLKAWTQLKSQHSLKIILSVGGEGASCKKFAWVGAEAYRRERFSTSAKHLLQLYDLDGIDLNWGDPASSEDGQHLLELVKTVRKSFKTKYMITACVPAIENILERLPLSALAIQLDLVNLMAYNFVDSRSTDTGHHAQLSTRQKARSNAGEQSCEIVVGYLKRNGVPPSKILLGVPLFGRSFLGNFGNGPHEPFIQAGGINGVHEVRNLPRPGTEEIYEDQLGAVWCCSGHEFVTYDGEESLFDKCWYCRDAGLAGLFYWHMGYDRAGDKSLIRKGWDTLNESRGGHS